MNKATWKKLIENKEAELKEITEIVQPSTFFGKLCRYARHPIVEQVMITNVQIKFMEREIRIIEGAKK